MRTMSKFGMSSRQHAPSGKREKQLLPLDRMDSTVIQLCDLHVYKVPVDLWRETFNNITNNVVTETVSIGIIRVPSETKLVDLRDEIIQQLQPDDLGPRDWVFLRSVGRCLTRLRSKQEYQLKAKHFLPPVSFAPELYILEATPEVRDALAISDRMSSQSPPLSRHTSPSHRGHSNSYRNGYGGENDQAQSGYKPSSPVHKYNTLPNIPHTSPPSRHNRNTYNTQHMNENNTTLPYYSKDIDSNKHNYEDTHHRENYDRYKSDKHKNDEYNRQNNSAHKHDHNKTQYDETQLTGTAPPHDLRPKSHEKARISPEKSSSRDFHRRPDDDSGVAEMSPEDDYHNRSSSRRRHNHQSRRDDYDMLANRLESERLGFGNDSESEEERRRRLEDMEGMGRMDRERWEEDQEQRRRQAEEDRKREEEEDRRRREEESKRQKQFEEEQKRRKEEEERRKRKEEEEQRRLEEEKLKAQEEERLRNEVKTPEQDDQDPLSRDTESARHRRREEMEKLLREAEEARQERQQMEREREELVKKTKALQHKTTNRRNDARDMWKKKYFEEKKKTAPLEENSNRLRAELEALHRRLMNTLEGPKEKNHIIHTNPSQKNNYIIQCTKLQHENSDLQRRVANAKMKLTAEMKLRNQAQGELRALRAELAERKHNLVKSRQQQLAALTPRPFEHPSYNNEANLQYAYNSGGPNNNDGSFDDARKGNIPLPPVGGYNYR